MRRRDFIKSGSVVSAGLIAGCSSNSDGGDTPEPTNGGGETSASESTATRTSESTDLSQDSISILTTFYPGASYAGVVNAKRFGYLEDVGFEDVSLEWSFELNPLQVVNEGDFDIVISSHVDQLFGKARGIPIETVLTTQGNAVHTYHTLADSGIESIEDFPGHTLGIQNDPDALAFSEEIFAQELTSSTQADINQQTVGYDIRLLLENDVDIFSTYPTNPDVSSLMVTDTAEFNLFPMKDYIDVPGNVVLTSEEFASNHGDVVTEYARAHARGLEDALDPQMTDDVVEACHNELDEHGVDDIYLEGAEPSEVIQNSIEMFREFRHIDEWDENGIGWNPVDRVATARDLLRANDQLEADIPEEDLVTNDYINEVMDENGDLIWDV